MRNLTIAEYNMAVGGVSWTGIAEIAGGVLCIAAGVAVIVESEGIGTPIGRRAIAEGAGLIGGGLAAVGDGAS